MDSPVASNVNLDWDKLKPRSALFFESSEHYIDLRQPMPKLAQCKGQMVISWMFAGVWTGTSR